MNQASDPGADSAEASGPKLNGADSAPASSSTRVAGVFGEALETPAADRAAYLDRACAGDAELRAEVESLLEAYAAGAPAFFQRPLQMTSSGELLTELFGSAAPGTRIGPYRIVRLLASGGMGAVYLAERTDEAFQKRVAIKLLHPLAGSDAVARFRIERQVLADLEHPGIARLIDGGAMDGGVPYLVMEYVDGVPITRYCEEHGLDVRARLHLFLEVCDAVQYAHQNLVIHRDLKPSNIFVDHTGRVRLLDFGIAKVLAGAGAPHSDVTSTLQLLTPRYASPEQVLGSRMTTATDIYSLGVVLYEILSGHFPYDLESKSPTEIARIIARADPIPPSRHPNPQASRSLEEDLDMILLKALQKEPARRYVSVEDFAGDIRRYLEGLPVVARPDTAAYRVSKFVARHKVWVGGATAALLLIFSALGVTLAAYRRAASAHREAESQAYVASLAATESSILTDHVDEAARHLESAPQRLRSWEWFHLRARLDRSLEFFRAHGKAVTQIEFLPGGDRLVTASLDSTIKIWNGTSGRIVRSFGPLGSEVESVAPVAGTRLLAAGLNNGRVVVLDEADGSSRELQPPGHSFAFVSTSPDGARISCGFFDGVVQVWSLPAGSVIAEWKAHDGLALPAYSPDGKLFATTGGQGNVILYDTRTYGKLHEFRAHSRRVYCMAFSPDGSTLITGSMDRTVCVWDVKRRALVHTFREHSGTITAIAFDPHEDAVLTSAGDGRLIRWSRTTGTVLGEFRGHVNDVSTLAEHPNGTRVISADWNGFVKSWSWETQDVRTLRVETGWLIPEIYSAAWSPEDDRLVAVSNVLSVIGWSRTWRRISAYASEVARCVAFSADGAFLMVGNDSGRIVRFSVAASESPRTVRAHRLPILGMDLHPDGHMLATAAADSSVKLWHVPALEPIQSLEGHLGAVEDVEFAPRGDVLASCGADGMIRLWEPTSGRLLGVLDSDGHPVQDVAFDPSGAFLVSSSRNGGVRIWDLAARRTVRFLGSDRSRVLSVAWSRDGSRVAAGGGDGVLRLYDASSGREVISLHGHISGITSLEFGRGDSVLTSTSRDGTVRIWDSPKDAVNPRALSG